MEVKNWERIESLFHTALSLEAEARAEYLDLACSGDVALRAEVESLLTAFKGGDDFLEDRAFDLGMKVLSRNATSESLAGRLIGPYKILDQLGKGGMGEVYLAEDMRLGRKVALKFLSAGLVDDSWAKRQLNKEAQSVAMLEHPNICAVYGFEEAEGYSFIVMQYAEGETLAAHIRRRPPDAAQAFSFAVQIVSAIAEAHAHDIIHRDIKPQNIVATSGGQIKVLDFGLAKTVQLRSGVGALTDDTSQLSKNGLVVGTVAYMSPEQLRGERLDFRSDIFSLGIVLYEMFSGQSPFARASDADIISAILNSQPPPLRGAAPDVSAEFERLVHKCLKKDRAERYHSASELLYELSELRDASKFHPRWHQRTGPRAAAVFAIVLLLLTASAFIYARLGKAEPSSTAATSTAAPARSKQPAAPDAHSLAVLPISNESADRGTDYLGDALTEALINKLSSLSDLRVKPFTSVSGYRGAATDPQAAGRELDVEVVLTGEIVRERNSLVLRSRLIRSSDGSQVWVGEYRIAQSDILSFQDQLAGGVINSLGLRQEGDERLLASHGTTNPLAFQQYWYGRYWWRNRTEKNIEKAIRYFNEAIRLDPMYAQAYAGLANSYVLLSAVSFGKTPTEESMSKAAAAAKEALAINDNLAEAHTALGVVNLRYYWDWETAEREFKRAIEIKPDYAPAHDSYASLLIITGRPEEAIAESETAKNLDPFSPPTVMNFCRTLSLSHHYDRALACYDKLLEENPDYEHAQYLRALVLQRSGRTEEALAIFQKVYAKNKALAGAVLGYAYGKAGRRDEALQVLAEMERLSKQRYIPPQEFAIIYIGLGDNDNAFLWLEKAYDEHFAVLINLTVDPIFLNLRSDPRFASLVERLKLPPPQ